MKRMTTTITLITDYGTRDYYAGALKGVILGIAPDARIVDITHEIDPHDVTQGAYVLRQVWSWFPPETVHLAIVDPGVGTDRRVLLARYDGRFVIAPDNGLLTFVHRDFPAEVLRSLENRQYFGSPVSSTFHGRDVMAPVAAHLCNGVLPADFGPATDRIELLAVRHEAEVAGGALRGEVLYVDRFGTLITNIRAEQLASAGVTPADVDVLVNDRSIGSIRATFAEVPVGEPVALIGSTGALEIAVNQGRAVSRFGPPESVTVTVSIP